MSLYLHNFISTAQGTSHTESMIINKEAYGMTIILNPFNPNNQYSFFWYLLLFIAYSFYSSIFHSSSLRCTIFSSNSISFFFLSKRLPHLQRRIDEIAREWESNVMWKNRFCGNYNERKGIKKWENHSPFLHHNGFYTLVNIPDFYFIFFSYFWLADARSHPQSFAHCRSPFILTRSLCISQYPLKSLDNIKYVCM